MDRAIDRLAFALPPDKPGPHSDRGPVYALGGRPVNEAPKRWRVRCCWWICGWRGKVDDLVPIKDEDGKFVGCPDCRTDEFLRIYRPRRRVA